MQIQDGKVVIMNYVLKDSSGEVIDSSQNGDFAYLHGANNIIPGLEKELLGKTSGDSFSVVVPPEEAYGERSDKLIQNVSKEMFKADSDIEVGMRFNAQASDGSTIIVTVADVDGDTVTIDGNHQLAGESLEFDVTVVEVRDASDEELAHGHVHGPGDDHHE